MCRRCCLLSSRTVSNKGKNKESSHWTECEKGERRGRPVWTFSSQNRSKFNNSKPQAQHSSTINSSNIHKSNSNRRKSPINEKLLRTHPRILSHLKSWPACSIRPRSLGSSSRSPCHWTTHPKQWKCRRMSGRRAAWINGE
mmetsp:Transcript_25286/g.58376  ORF Transcript_25286/g.58376 Transcript_25286/m.58376 type:complete len:141 (+) Transcript_25286:261-683(+)